MADKIASPHVVVVGGGFAGIACAQALARNGDVRVTLLDKNNFHQFQPLLYQVATSQLAPGDVAYSLRKLFVGNAKVDVKLADVVAVDPQTRTVRVRSGETYSARSPTSSRRLAPTSSRSRSIRSTMPNDYARASWKCSRMWIGSRCSLSKARSTS